MSLAHQIVSKPSKLARQAALLGVPRKSAPENATMEIRDIALASIKLDQRAQPRDHLSTEKTAEYAEAMAEGASFPPLVVFEDETGTWLADGFHRHYAAQGAGRKVFACEVRVGGLRDAILYSVGANATHGYPRTNADKRRAVQRLLDDAEWGMWSDAEIARRCSVSHPFVGKLRPIPETVTGIEPTRTFVHPRSGKPTQMNVGGMARDRPKPLAEPEQDRSHISARPAHSPANMDDDTRAAFAADTANRDIALRLQDIDRFIAELPAPVDAAELFPTRLRHTFTKHRALEIRDWFDAFATHYHDEEICDVAAE